MANDAFDLMETGITGKKKKSSLCTIVTGVTILVLVGLSIAGIYYMVKYSELVASEKSGTPGEPGLAPSSCLEVQEKYGQYVSNYYVIQPTPESSPFLTYCDMETNEGGWTLVASVHETDIDDKCATDDIWFSRGFGEGSTTSFWANTNVTNSPDTSTTNDYKNAGYYALKASDVMVRHVPNGSPVSESKSRASMEYYNNNKFLENYGGNLQTVFADHFPLEPAETSDEIFGPSIIEDMLDDLVEKASAGGILNTTVISQYYRYSYNDSSSDRILSEGNDNLFDPYGMLITVISPDCPTFTLEYGKTYSCDEASSRKSYPFFALMKTGSTRTPDSYQYKIESFRTNSDDQSNVAIVGDLVNGNLSLNYYLSCKYSESVKNYCDMWFTVFSPSLWGSENMTGNTPRYNTATYSNAVYGYTMIARDPMPNPTDYEFPYEVIMLRILEVLATFHEQDIQGMLNALEANGESLLNMTVPEYYEYVYDNTTPNRLTDGGNNLFHPYGMEVSLDLKDTSTSISLDYGQSTTLNNNRIQASSRKTYPFFALAKTENLDDLLGVSVSQGRPLSDELKIASYNGINLKIGNFTMAYDADCHYSEIFPSFCNIIFFVYNPNEWNSQSLTVTSYSATTASTKNISGVSYPFLNYATYSRYTNAIVGYTLIAREPGQTETPFQVQDILKNILEVFSRYPTIASKCADPSNNLVVPIEYAIGSTTGSRVAPPNLRNVVNAGFMQFRAVGCNGNVYAFCPAVSVSTCSSDFICVGGATRSSVTSDDCSDFLDWADYENRNSTSLPEEAQGNTHSKSDIQPTIMIFYR